MTRVASPGPGISNVVVTELEMTDPAQLRPGRLPEVNPTVVRALRPAPELSRFFYRAVGGDWYWLDRLSWTYEQWTEWVSSPGHELWSCWVEGVPAGYFELDRQNGEVELAYFGLLRGFAGLGLGGWLLTEAIARAWDAPDTTRVWVHTCELDSPTALANYESRGFVPRGTTIEYWDTRAPSPGPWRGSR